MKDIFIVLAGTGGGMYIVYSHLQNQVNVLCRMSIDWQINFERFSQDKKLSARSMFALNSLKTYVFDAYKIC